VNKKTVTEGNEVSLHEVKVYLALRSNPGQWITNADIERAASVPRRTVRWHTRRLVNLGIVDQAEVFPAHRYRLADKADKRNGSYARRLEQAVEIFGL
jgi:predicted transcriptional regulator